MKFIDWLKDSMFGNYHKWNIKKNNIINIQHIPLIELNRQLSDDSMLKDIDSKKAA